MEIGDRHLVVFVLLLTGSELLAKLFQLLFHFGKLLLALWFVFANLVNRFLRVGQFLFQVIILRNQHFDAMFALFQSH